jgi:hypothetical protein
MPAGFFWSSDAYRLRRAYPSHAQHAGKRERTPLMDSTLRDLLFLTPMGIAVAFMLWVLWNFHKAERER